MTPRRSLLALSLSLFALGGYVLSLGRALGEGGDELRVIVEAPREEAGAPSRAPWRARLVDPTAEARVRRFVDEGLGGGPSGVLPRSPGLHLARWRSRHLGRRPRELAYVYLAPGRPGGEGGFLPSAARLTIAQGELDGSAGDDLARALSAIAGRILRAEVSRRSWVERKIIDLLLGALRGVRVGVRVVARGLAIRVGALFRVGGESLEVIARARLGVQARGGRIHLSSGPISVGVSGQGKIGGWRKVGITLGAVLLEHVAPARLRATVERLLPRAEAFLAALLSQGFVITALDTTLRVELRPHQVAISPGNSLGVVFDLRLRDRRGVVLPPARLSPSPRRARRGAAHAVGAKGKVGGIPGVVVSLHVDVINAALAAIWRGGGFDRLGARGVSWVEGSLDPKLLRLVAFEVTRAHLLQAPMLMPKESSAPRVVVGALRLALRPLASASASLPRAVDLYGRFGVRLALREGAMILHLTTHPMSSSCGAGTRDDPLRACFSELVGLANQWLARQRSWKIPLGMGASWGRWSFAMPPGRLRVVGHLRQARLLGDEVTFGGWVSMKAMP